MRARFASNFAGDVPAVHRPEVIDVKEQVLRLLKDSLIKELVCVIRYNHLSADTGMRPQMTAEFLLHTHEELAHAYKLARYIAALGGDLDYSPDLVMRMSRATHEYHPDLPSMIASHLKSQRALLVKYAEIVHWMDAQDVFPRRLLEEIVEEERAHAEELQSWLAH